MRGEGNSEARGRGRLTAEEEVGMMSCEDSAQHCCLWMEAGSQGMQAGLQDCQRRGRGLSPGASGKE